MAGHQLQADRQGRGENAKSDPWSRWPCPRSQVPGPRLRSSGPRLHINCRSSARQGLGWWRGTAAYLLSVAFVGFLFSFMLFKCFIKIAYGNGGRGQAVGAGSRGRRQAAGGRRQGDLCQRHHRGTHCQQQKSIFSDTCPKSNERKQHGGRKKIKRRRWK